MRYIDEGHLEARLIDMLCVPERCLWLSEQLERRGDCFCDMSPLDDGCFNNVSARVAWRTVELFDEQIGSVIDNV